MSKEKILLIAMSWADAMLVQAINTMRRTATAPDLPAMAVETVHALLAVRKQANGK